MGKTSISTAITVGSAICDLSRREVERPLKCLFCLITYFSMLSLQDLCQESFNLLRFVLKTDEIDSGS